MKKLLPLLLLAIGLGAGVGAGLAMKPSSACAAGAAPAPAEEAHAELPAMPCAPAEGDPADAAAAEDHGGGGDHDEGGGPQYFAIDKPFIVPVFRDERMGGMVVLSLSLELGSGYESAASTLQPRLRDGFLAVLFRHANSGGFDGSFTSGQKIDDLKNALLVAAREVLPPTAVNQVLITEIVRQDA